MINTLLATILVEGIVVVGYSRWCRKPLLPILLTATFANALTQFLLWIGMMLFFQHYLSTLFFAELLIWMLESILLYRIRANKLRLPEAIFLSLVMNLVSFGAGLLIPS